ncbi:glycosyltransferase family 2 protein [Macellibacteroides fermentans]|uniref:glycosyltransferase family 2 protein n=1 Tax=Macellibacteroides fermentans TaxID=879969 RepID=UPI00406D063A
MTEQNKQPLVSVIMPVYNGEKTIKLAINSLLNQTYKNWICIIVNDGSTDGTKSILDSINDSRFKIIHLQKNVGRGAARQVALDNAVGDYLAYLDADDFYHFSKLERQVNTFTENPNLDLVGTKLLSFDENYKAMTIRGVVFSKPKLHKNGNNLILAMPTSMIRLDEAKKIKYNPVLNASEDLDYFSKYLDGKFYFVLDDILLYYLISDTTTYKKILEYTSFEILRGFYLLKNNFLISMKIILLASAKYFIYLILIPILGTKFFINKRGRQPFESELHEFNKQLSFNTK